MKLNKFITLIFLVLIMGIIYMIPFYPYSDNQSGELDNINTIQEKGDRAKIIVDPFDEKSFNFAVGESRNNFASYPDCQIKAGVVPHHLLAGFMAAGFFSRLAQQEVKTIILVGPNHREKGSPIVVADGEWETIYGNVLADEGIINSLKKEKLVEINNELVAGDHSIYALIPFIKYYLPKANVVTILFSRGNSQEEVETVVSALNKKIEEKGMVLVSSIDFSHYLTIDQAQKKDQETLSAINNFSFGEIYNYTSDNLDSPASLALFLEMAQKIGTRKVEVIEHHNSADITKTNPSSTTSYFSLAFCQAD